MMRRAFSSIALVTTTAFLVGCAVGPDFEKPAAPDVARYTDSDLPEKTAATDGVAGAAQTFAAGTDAPVEWWKLYGSEPLNQLMVQALKNNPDLKAASAALVEARENYKATSGDLLPSVDASFEPTREKINPAAFGQTGAPSSIFTLYNASVSVSYGIDVFGGTRRAVEESKAQADYENFERDAAYMTLTANVVTAAVQEASLSAQIKETQRIIDIEGSELSVMQKQFELGATAKSIVLQQQAILAQTKATLPALQQQHAAQRSQLAVLVGVLPGKGPVGTFDLATLHLPETLPVSLPSKLVEQRPDIRAAEEQLHAASADIGVATANMLPQFSITGSYGSESTKTGKLFTGGSEVWSLGGSILQPIFRGGELLHEKRAAVAAYDKAAAQYESTVLTAFKNVADTLRALQYDADALGAQVEAAAAAKGSLELTQEQYKDGSITYPQLLDAQRTYQQARINLVQAQAARFNDTAALFQALGGSMHEPSSNAVATDPAPAAATPSTPPNEQKS